MKATELRIGNLVMVEVKNGDYYDDYEGVVINIYNLHVLVEVVNEDGGVIHVTKHILSVRSIPLTEECLLKLGFTLITSDCESPSDWYFRHDNLTGSIDNLTWKYTHQNGLRLKYVHQLQNLYFALTGEELTLKQ